jgi:phosphoesterase RecJ-like protein
METIIDIVRATSEADVAAVVKQLGERRWSVSLRSKTQVDVAAVAISLGGGGHQRSAGFTFMGTSEQAVAALVTALG